MRVPSHFLCPAVEQAVIGAFLQQSDLGIPVVGGFDDVDSEPVLVVAATGQREAIEGAGPEPSLHWSVSVVVVLRTRNEPWTAPDGTVMTAGEAHEYLSGVVLDFLCDAECIAQLRAAGVQNLGISTRYVGEVTRAPEEHSRVTTINMEVIANATT